MSYANENQILFPLSTFQIFITMCFVSCINTDISTVCSCEHSGTTTNCPRLSILTTVIVICRTYCGNASCRAQSQLLVQQQLKHRELIAWAWTLPNCTVALRQRVPPAGGCVWRHSQMSGLDRGTSLIENVCQSSLKTVSSTALMKVAWLKLCMSTETIFRKTFFSVLD